MTVAFFILLFFTIVAIWFFVVNGRRDRVAWAQKIEAANRALEQNNLALKRALDEANEKSLEAEVKAREIIQQAESGRDEILLSARDRAASIVSVADSQAEAIAGKALDAVKNAELYEQTAKAMRNIVEGYGDQYLVPAASLLDALAHELAHTDAGQQLKDAREASKVLVKAGKAAACLYVESSRRGGAERFVLDAFNGKVDSILSRVRHDNYGKLDQEIADAAALVNFGGKAFRDARVTDEYVEARKVELKWAVAAQEIVRQDREEQRRIREQIREEEKARREYERALKDAVKEEEVVQKAIARAQAQIAGATEAQRAKYEVQLEELAARLKVAEEKGQRAMSLAQQTKRGYVYVISNVGSFGDGVVKIGLTRRLEPLDRVRELGDASVPFEFDVHALIWSEDAPDLERKLHKHFVLAQVNKVNHRKEFFRASIASLRSEIERLGISASWTLASAAIEYRESVAIEKSIEVDSRARNAWLERQLKLDPVVEGVSALENES